MSFGIIFFKVLGTEYGHMESFKRFFYFRPYKYFVRFGAVYNSDVTVLGTTYNTQPSSQFGFRYVVFSQYSNRYVSITERWSANAFCTNFEEASDGFSINPFVIII